MWARRCGAAPGWPSRVKVLIQSFVSGSVGFAVFQYMSGADLGYLDLSRPGAENVTCVTEWPLRHSLASWSDDRSWRDWVDYRDNMTVFVSKHRCSITPPADESFCSTVHAPLREMSRNLGIPLIPDDNGYSWGNDAVETYGYLFLWVTVCMWVMVTVHDLALLTVRNRNFILDLQSIRKFFPCWRKLWILVGFRCWKRLARGKGAFHKHHWCKRFGRIVAWVAAPVFVVWGLVVFHLIVIPVVTLFFVCYPIRLSRVVIFLNSLAAGVFGICLTIHCIVFLADVETRQQYAVTWSVSDDQLTPCTCGCVYPLNSGRVLSLLFIGILVAYKAFILAFRCLKGLRRSNWANLMSVLFPIPLNVYEVYWTQPNGEPIQYRKVGEPVQGELAFDPFALMDEQMESGRTTLTLVPTPVEEEKGPESWTEQDVKDFFEELSLNQYCDAVGKHGIDGSTLLDMFTGTGNSEGISQLGITSQLHVSKIRGRLASLTAAKTRSAFAVAAERQRSRPANAASRTMAGPQTITKDLPRNQRHLDYVGCCGFPCRKGEHSGKLRIVDSDSEREDIKDIGPSDEVPMEHEKPPPQAERNSETSVHLPSPLPCSPSSHFKTQL